MPRHGPLRPPMVPPLWRGAVDSRFRGNDGHRACRVQRCSLRCRLGAYFSLAGHPRVAGARPLGGGTMKRLGHPETAFPVGVEYYRVPTPKQECWDGDFARLRAAGFRIVRSHSYWNAMEPRPGQYELDDFDRLFDLAARHDLSVWMDIMLATHGACPEWLMREYPDMRVVNYRGQRAESFASGAYPQGGAMHCYDHPAWREYGGALIRHVVQRYKDRPNLLIWGLWDGINIISAWSRITDGYPCYCDYTIARYKAWLRERYTLDQLQRAAAAALPAVGGRAAAAVEQQRCGDAALPGVSLSELGRSSAMDGRRGRSPGPRARGARTRGVVSAPVGRAVRRARG